MGVTQLISAVATRTLPGSNLGQHTWECAFSDLQFYTQLAARLPDRHLMRGTCERSDDSCGGTHTLSG